MNLFLLMLDSGISDDKGRPCIDIQRLDKMYEKFKLKLDDVQAEVYFLELIDSCYKERMNIVYDKLHILADWWRKV